MKTERFMQMWQQAQDLTFGEMREVVAAAEQAASKKLHEIRKRAMRLLRQRGGMQN